MIFPQKNNPCCRITTYLLDMVVTWWYDVTMNRTEVLAHNWLLTNGYTGLVFRSHKTPGFLTEQGDSFEVKLSRNGTIWFACDQFEDLLLMDKAKVLVFSDKSFPDAIIPVEELRMRPIGRCTAQRGYQHPI